MSQRSAEEPTVIESRESFGKEKKLLNSDYEEFKCIKGILMRQIKVSQ